MRKKERKNEGFPFLFGEELRFRISDFEDDFGGLCCCCFLLLLLLRFFPPLS